MTIKLVIMGCFLMGTIAFSAEETVLDTSKSGHGVTSPTSGKEKTLHDMARLRTILDNDVDNVQRQVIFASKSPQTEEMVRKLTLPDDLRTKYQMSKATLDAIRRLRQCSSVAQSRKIFPEHNAAFEAIDEAMGATTLIRDLDAYVSLYERVVKAIAPLKTEVFGTWLDGSPMGDRFTHVMYTGMWVEGL